MNAKQVALGREVAVKIFSPSLAHNPTFAARFVREAQIIARLNHPQIVHIMTPANTTTCSIS